MEFFFIIFFVLFILAFVTIGFGFFRAARFSRKVFDHVENQLDRQMSRESERDAECEFCGTRTGGAESCPNCGAPVA